MGRTEITIKIVVDSSTMTLLIQGAAFQNVFIEFSLSLMLPFFRLCDSLEAVIDFIPYE
jgi:hypothetical protein